MSTELSHAKVRFWQRAGLIGAVAFALAWIGSGGLVVERSAEINYPPFNGHPVIRLEVVNRPAPGLPMVLRYDSDRARLGLRVSYITHADAEGPAFTVDWCDLTFADGSKIDLTDHAQVGQTGPAPYLSGTAGRSTQ
jgi:hypothetical protein